MRLRPPGNISDFVSLSRWLSDLYREILPFDEGLVGDATWNPGSIADGDIATTTVTVPNATVGYRVSVGFPLLVSGVAATAGVVLSGQVSAPDTVTVVLLNKTGGAIDLDSGSLKVRVYKN